MRSLFFALIPFLFVACAKDKDSESYRKDQVQKNLAKLQAADGTYSGLVYSQTDGSTMGALEVNIRSQMRAVNGTGGTGADNEAISIASIRFVNRKSSTVTAQNAFYDPDKKDFTAQAKITGASGQTEQISLDGQINDGKFNGSIEVTNYHGFGGKFILEKDGPSADSLVNVGSSPTDAPLYSRSFKAETTFFKDNGREKVNTVPATLVVLQSSTSPELDFLNAFVPVKTVQVTLNYSDSLKLLHSNALWDLRNGTLTGSTSWTQTNGGSIQTILLNLNCTSQGIDEKMIWRCNHSTSSQGIVAKTESYYDNRIVSDTVGASTAPIQVNFTKGLAKFKDHDGKYKTTKARLRAVLPTRTRDERLVELFFPPRIRGLNLTISMFEESASVTVNYSPKNTSWDLSNASLEASENLGNGVTSNFSCTNFYFDDTKSSFDCQYFATYAADTFYIHFEQ